MSNGVAKIDPNVFGSKRTREWARKLVTADQERRAEMKGAGTREHKEEA